MDDTTDPESTLPPDTEGGSTLPPPATVDQTTLPPVPTTRGRSAEPVETQGPGVPAPRPARRPHPVPPLPVPPSLTERFEVAGVLGMGGMAVVYRARDRRLGREVALKLIRAPSDDLRRRFEVEGRLLAALEHERVVRLYDLGFADGTPYMVMELVRGNTLAARLAAGRPTAVDAARLLLDVLEGLGAAHARGIVHRDLKPGNVFLDESGRAKVADFGLARVDGGEVPEELGRLVGTPGYMAPEQARGEHVGAPSDIYAVGVMLHEMLTGRRLFSGASAMEVVRAQLAAVPAAPSSANPAVPPALDELTLRALAAAPAERPTVAELSASLAAWLDRATGARRASEALPAEPYKLLEAFGEADAPLYFGRDGEVRELADLLDSPVIKTVSVFGPCGIGKSSLLRAGLARGLDLGRRELVVLLAGADPERAVREWVADRFEAASRVATENAALAVASRTEAGPLSTDAGAAVAPELVVGVLRAALRGSARTLVLVVDQLEELFTLNARGSPRVARFFALVERLAEVRDPALKVVLSYRTEFRGELFALEERLGHAHRAAPLREIAEAGLAEAIEGPSRLPGYGFAYAPGFAARLAGEILAGTRARGETALPVMQIVCRQLHDRMKAKGLARIDAALYESALGGARGALERWVEERLGSADYQGRAPMARQMLKALTLKEEGGERFARALPEDEVLAFPDREAARATLERLVSDHLVIRDAAPDGGRRVRLASEVICPLVDAWALVPDATERAARLLARAYRQWSDQGRRQEDLLAGGALLAVLREVPGLRELSADERRFLALARERHRRRRAAGFTAGFVVVALGALVVWMAYLRPGRLELTSQPPGAQVYLAGRLLGVTPLDRELPPGPHELTFTHPRYRDRVEAVVVPVGGRVVHQANLLYPYGVLALSYAPAGAHWTVHAEGAAVDAPPLAQGDAPRQLELPEGRYRVALSHPRYAPFSAPVTILPGRESTPVEERLVSLTGRLEVVGGEAGARLAVSDAKGRVVAEATLPLRAPLELDEGPHGVVASRSGVRWERRSIAVTRGTTTTLALRMPAVRELWSRQRAGFGPARALATDVNGDGDTDLLVADGARLLALDGPRGEPLWTVALPVAAALAPMRSTTAALVPLADGGVFACGVERGQPLWTRRLPERAAVAVLADVDGDGRPELVLAAGRRVLALGAATGASVWERATPGGALAGLTATSDVDGDGRPDFVACDDEGWIGALSGRDGALLWEARVPGGRAERTARVDLDGDGAEDVVAATTEGGGRLVALSGRTGKPLWRAPAPRIASAPCPAVVDGRPAVVALATDGALYVVDAGGRARAPFATEALRPGKPPALAAVLDLDGDGASDAVITTHNRVSAWSTAGRRALWSRDVQDVRRGATVVADLDGDGTPDLIVCCGAARVYETDGGRDGALLALSGRTGETLWTLPSDQFDDLFRAPDLDGDGWPDLLAFTRTGIRVLSTRADAPLWIAELAGESRTPAVSAPPAFAFGVDERGIARVDAASGAPLAELRIAGRGFSAPALLARTPRGSGGAGAERSPAPAPPGARGEGPRPDRATPREEPGDGVAGSPAPARPGARGEGPRSDRATPPEEPGAALVVGDDAGGLFAFLGGRPLWNTARGAGVRLLQALADVDGDGAQDLLVLRDDGAFGLDAELVSGADGHPLWEHTPRDGALGVQVDLDGDGVPDVVCGPAHGGLTAWSGRSGRPLWTAAVHRVRERPAVVVGDGGAVLLVPCGDAHLHALDARGRSLWTADCGTAAGRVLALGARAVAITSTDVKAFDARTGAVLWSVPLRAPLPHACAAAAADLDGDGDPDLLVVTGVNDAGPGALPRLEALAGRTGRTLWSRAQTCRPWSVETLADQDGDGIADVLVGRVTRAGPSSRTVLVSGRDGHALASVEGLALASWTPAQRVPALEAPGQPPVLLAREFAPGPRTVVFAQRLVHPRAAPAFTPGEPLATTR